MKTVKQEDPQKAFLKLPFVGAQQLVAYLQARPWGEVHELIQMLLTLKLLEEETTNVLTPTPKQETGTP